MSGHEIYAAGHLVGGMTSEFWDRDPKRLGFVLARYKFVARVLEGKEKVLEVGCADGFGSRVVRQHVGRLVAVDIDEKSIAEANARQSTVWPVEFRTHDILRAPITGFDAVYALDLIEHIDPLTEERTFLENMRTCAPVAIFGSPSFESQVYASELSKKGHVNCMTAEVMRKRLLGYWEHVFMLGMNDETLHTGFGAMCHYRLAVCVG